MTHSSFCVPPGSSPSAINTDLPFTFLAICKGVDLVLQFYGTKARKYADSKFRTNSHKLPF